MTPSEQVQEKIAALKAELDKQNPGISSYLRDIHRNLIEDESIVQILTPEEIGVIISGASLLTKTQIVADSIKKNKSALKNLTLDDL